MTNQRGLNLGYIGNYGCNEMCPENCLSSWNVYTQKNGTFGTGIIDEKIILSCGRITFQNIFTLIIFRRLYYSHSDKYLKGIDYHD